MQGVNIVIMAGNITKDPELKDAAGTPVLNMAVAVNRKYKTKGGEYKDDVAFVPVVVWGKAAENCAQYLKKGSAVMVSGRLQQRSWEDQQGGKRSVLEVVAEQVQFMDGKPRDGEGEASPEGEG